MSEPNSRLTLERPDIWLRGLNLATALTGYMYVSKVPLADGSVSMCGGGWIPSGALTPSEQIVKIRDQIKGWESYRGSVSDTDIDAAIARLQKQIKELGGSLSAPVPEGAMEWLLHEVGHFVAATPEERLLPNYGYGTLEHVGKGRVREWQAWGFEEIILRPFGDRDARLFAAPSYRGGVAFEKNTPIPEWAERHALREIETLGVDVEQWRTLYGVWIKWEPRR